MFPFLMCSSLHWYGWSIYYIDVCLPQPSPPAWGYKWGLFPINTWIPLVSSPSKLTWKSQSFPKPIYSGNSKAVRFLCSRVRPLNVCCLLCGSAWLSCAHSGADTAQALGHEGSWFLVLTRLWPCMDSIPSGKGKLPFLLLTSVEDTLGGCMRPTTLENWVRQLL